MGAWGMTLMLVEYWGQFKRKASGGEKYGPLLNLFIGTVGLLSQSQHEPRSQNPKPGQMKARTVPAITGPTLPP